ncbi:MAG: DNA polymerase IV [Deltaproteobacteria bacterium]|nr:DNA polymerase IV [Deltaproteobacteria bacterium]
MERPVSRTIAHADMDAFYASVEQRDRPELRGRPVIVGGGGPRGVVSAASYEARKFGVHSAMPGYEARRRCPDGVFLSGDMARYRRESRRIFEIFRRFTPAVEGLSLDEAFLDLTGTERLLGPARGVAERLRREVRDEVGLAVSVGIAPIKMVAKLASESAKPDGLLEISREGLLEFLHPLPVRRMWGVGPVTGERLAAAGFHTVRDLARADRDGLEKLLGDWGGRLARLARGEDVREVEPYRDTVSMSEENTFSGDVDDLPRLERAIVRHAESVARRLRRSEVLARTVVLKVKLGRRRAPGPRGYSLVTRRATLPEASDDGETISRVARGLLHAWGLPEPIRLLGVGVTNLVPGDAAQLPLFEQGRARRERLNQALDQIADRFGSEALSRGEPGSARRAGLSDQIKRGARDDEA